MTAGQYPTITNGMGNLTPDMWRRLMTMLADFESKNRDEQKVTTGKGGMVPFLAKITKAQCVSVNKYEYAWVQVALNDDNTATVVDGGKTSTGENDEWDFSAINLLEISNTASRGSVGVDLSSDDYPAGYTLQVLGGGSTTTGTVTPNVEPIVLMHKVSGRSVESTARYVFTATNENDGECSYDLFAVTDAIAAPSTVSGVAQIYVDNSDGDLKVRFGDGTIKTIVVDT